LRAFQKHKAKRLDAGAFCPSAGLGAHAGSIQAWLALIILGGVALGGCGQPEAATSTTILPTAAIVARAPAASEIIITPLPLLVTPTQTSQRSAPKMEPIGPSPTSAPVAPAEVSATPSAIPADDPALLEALLVTEINSVRAANGLPPYQHSPELSAAARAHSCDMAAHGMISHTSSDGRTLGQRLEGAEPPWEWPSESIAAGFADPAAIVALWMDEPPEGWHRRNILDELQRDVGAGYCYAEADPTGNRHYWTADFSRRAGDQ
jgi:uncharacterized protein YkwD